MRITLDLPEDLARHFAADAEGLSRAALEALAIEGVRSGKLTTGQVRRALGFRTRYEVDGFLKERGVYLPLTVNDVRRDAETALGFGK